MRTRAGLLVLALMVVAVAGCGESDPTAATPSAATPAPGAPAAATAAAAPSTAASSVAASSVADPPGAGAATAKPTAGVTHVPRPNIVWDPVPFGPKRKAEMVAYVRRHYGSFMKPTWRLVDPHVIVIHYTDASYSSTYNTFATDVPDSELQELPTTCAHFVIDARGVIHQLVSEGTMCRHTVGLNWTAIGIEHVGFSDAQVLGDRRQITSSLRLVRWLRCRFGIEVRNVIGHNESLSSPYHHEDVASLRAQTHSDFVHADMQVYRRRLRALGGCPALRNSRHG